MGAVSFIRDRLTNVMSGMGTSVDRARHAHYRLELITPEQVEAAYRSSWLVRKIIDVPPLDMTRAWRDWQADANDIQALEAEESRLQLKAKCKRALTLARLYGGGAIILGTGDQDPTQPLNVDAVKKGGLLYAHVMSRHQLSHGEAITDPTSEWFGKPSFFEIRNVGGTSVKMHPSRVVEFVGQRTPEGSIIGIGGDWFWGDPIMQSIGDAVNNANTAQAGFAALIDEAKIDVLRMKDLMSLTATDDGDQKLMRRLEAAKMGKSTYRALVLDMEDEWDQKQVAFAGIPEMLDAYLLIVAGAADIPMTRLLGQSPKGLQSNGDGEERDYQSMIAARQDEQLHPALERIDDLLIRSALGSRPSDIHSTFAPLSQLNEKDAAAIELTFAQVAQIYSTTGDVPDIARAAMVRNGIIERGQFPGAEAAFEEADLNPEPEPTSDPSSLQATATAVQKMEKQGKITGDQAVRLMTDASPQTLYVSRKLLNGAEFLAWAKGQGFKATVPASDLHVAVLYSRTPVDWMKMGSSWSDDAKGQITVAPGGARIVQALGDKGAVVLLFSSSDLQWRHQQMVDAGASHDFDEYQSHVTITYDGADVDLATVEPFQGELRFGPEVFEELDLDWTPGGAQSQQDD